MYAFWFFSELISLPKAVALDAIVAYAGMEVGRRTHTLLLKP